MGAAALEDRDSPIHWFSDDLQKSRKAVEYFDLTLDSLLTMVKLPDDERPQFVRLMKQRLGVESTNDRLARFLSDDWLERVSSKPTDASLSDRGSRTEWEPVRARLTAESIKQAILHPDLRIREMAVSYFAHSYAGDASIMPLVIDAPEKHGKEGTT